MVPRAEFRSYYGKSVLNPPVWHSPDIPGYLFLGGLAGASSLLAAGADGTGRRDLARTGKLSVPARGRPVLVTCDGASEVAAPDAIDERLRAPGCADPLDPVSLECVLGDVIAAGGRLRIPALLAFLR